jgi:hypothetical protein
MLTAERLRELLDYCPESGVFTRRVSRGRAKAGSVAGCDDHKGHLVIVVDGRLYQAHRLAWLYVTGHWPKHEVDHVDGDGLRNAWTNLRSATHAENMRNSRRPRHNTSGFKGVSWHKRSQAWRAYIKKDRRAIHLGTFATPEAAHAAYVAAAQEHHGEFARPA